MAPGFPPTHANAAQHTEAVEGLALDSARGSPRAAFSSPRLLRPHVRPSSGAGRRVHFAPQAHVQQASSEVDGVMDRCGGEGGWFDGHDGSARELAEMRHMGMPLAVGPTAEHGSPLPVPRSNHQCAQMATSPGNATVSHEVQQQHAQFYHSTSWRVQPQRGRDAHPAGKAGMSQGACPEQQHHHRHHHQHQQEQAAQLPTTSQQHQKQQQRAASQPVEVRAGTICITVSSPRVELAQQQQKQQGQQPQQIHWQDPPMPVGSTPSHCGSGYGSMLQEHCQQQQPHPASAAACPPAAARAAGTRRPVSASDALPARLAAEHLGSLAGMSRKVQEALLHSQQLLQRQAAVVEQAVMARAFFAWRHLRAAQEQRRQATLAAHRRIAMGQLRRCLHAWRQLCGLQEGRQQVVLHAQAMLRRSLLQRCWREWQRVCRLRWWKVQLELRDAHIQRLDVQLRHLESRPVRLMHRYRMRTWLAAWRAEAQYLQAKQTLWAAAGQRARHHAQVVAFAGWQAITAEKVARWRTQQRAARVLGRLRLRHALAAWGAAVSSRASWRAASLAVQQMRQRQVLQRAVRGWRYISWFQSTARIALQQRLQKMLASVFTVWRQRAELAAARAALLAEMSTVRAARLVSRAFSGWLGVLEGCRSRRQQEDLDRLAEQAEQLAGENARLKEECERLSRVIDSREWSRERVAELLQAGRVLQEERDALAQLVASLQQQQGAGAPLLDATNSPPAAACSLSTKNDLLRQYNISALGDTQAASACAGMWPPSARPRSPGTDAAARNRLLLRGGSSFNAMVRALKQDLVATGSLPRSGPAAVLEVDKLSLNRISVAADGGLEVEAISSPDRQRVAFGRSHPPSPKRGDLAAGICATGGIGRAAGAGTARRAGPTAAHPARTSDGGRSGLLEAALRLQGIGGRSVGLQQKGT